MRHRLAGRKLGRTTSHRWALLRNMATSLFRNERITTTTAKAKELRPFAEKIITLAKRETLHARRQVLRHIKDREVVTKLFDTLGARYATRPGGYTRIIRTGFRRGDNAELAVIELIDTTEKVAKPKKAAAKKKAGPKKAAQPPRRQARKGTAREEALADVVAAEQAAEALEAEAEESAETEEAETTAEEQQAEEGGDRAAETAAEAKPEEGEAPEENTEEGSADKSEDKKEE